MARAYQSDKHRAWVNCVIRPGPRAKTLALDELRRSAQVTIPPVQNKLQAVFPFFCFAKRARIPVPARSSVEGWPFRSCRYGSGTGFAETTMKMPSTGSRFFSSSGLTVRQHKALVPRYKKDHTTTPLPSLRGSPRGYPLYPNSPAYAPRVACSKK